MWSGFEIGIALPYPHQSIEQDYNYVTHHPLAEAYRLYMPPPHNRPTWDLTSVLHAIRPDRGYFDLSPTGQVTVAGSINMDLVIRCDSLPVTGQTITARSSSEFCGGKGANQAVAAAMMNGDVWIVGRVGDDSFASRLLDNLRSHRIHTDAVAQSDDCPSGLAIVAVESSGQNAIMVVPGANGRVSRADILANRELIQSADVLLLQLEIPIDAVLAAIELARDANVRCVVDPAPVPPICSGRKRWVGKGVRYRFQFAEVHFLIGFFLGRPRGRMVDSKSKVRVTCSTHVSFPKGTPRLTLQSSNS